MQNDWNGLIPGLHRGLYDCVICGIEITPDKAEDMNFSLPYYFTFEQFVARLVSALTIMELTGAYNRLATETFDYFGAGLVVGPLYFVIGLPFARLSRALEKRHGKEFMAENLRFRGFR